MKGIKILLRVISGIVLFVVCTLFFIVLHDLFTGIDETISEGAAYGFEIGESKESVQRKIAKMYDSGMISSVNLGFSVRYFDLEQLSFLGPHFNGWFVYVAGGSGRLVFKDNDLVEYDDIGQSLKLELGMTRSDVLSFFHLMEDDALRFSFFYPIHFNQTLVDWSQYLWNFRYSSNYAKDFLTLKFSSDTNELYEMKRTRHLMEAI